jgi:hypothetical protein
MTRAALSLATALLLAGAGCGRSDTVDSQEVEDGIVSSLSTGTVKVTKADCPSDVKKQKGATFDCTVTLSNGGTGKVKVTQQGANRYTYAFVNGSVQIPGSSVDQQIETQLAKQGIANATVTCPSNIIVKENSPVTCNVTGAQGVAATEVTFEFSSADGEVSPSSVSTS